MEQLVLKNMSSPLKKIYFQINLRLFHYKPYKQHMTKSEVTR